MLNSLATPTAFAWAGDSKSGELSLSQFHVDELPRHPDPASNFSTAKITIPQLQPVYCSCVAHWTNLPRIPRGKGSPYPAGRFSGLHRPVSLLEHNPYTRFRCLIPSRILGELPRQSLPVSLRDSYIAPHGSAYRLSYLLADGYLSVIP